jgi:hypothetical protein
MWVIMSLAALVLMVVYFAMRLSINGHSDPVFSSLMALDVKPPPVNPAAPPPPPPPPAAPRLATILKPDIDAGWSRSTTSPTARSSSSRATVSSSRAARCCRTR